MDRERVADVLEEIALLLDLKGESPFKSRAYRSAATTIRALDRDLAELVRTGGLTALPGIGSALAEKITTLVDTGSLPYRDRLRAEVPRAAAIAEFLRIPGLGPRKAQVLAEKLQVGSLGELEYACHENRLLEIPGFGARAQEKILKGIERLRSYRGRLLLGDALPLAEELRAALAAAPVVTSAAIAGAVRRGEETVGEITLVVESEDTQAIVAALSRLPRVRDASPLRDASRITVSLDAGVPLHLAVVRPEGRACALLHRTGGAAHLGALQERARKGGLDLREDGLYRGREQLPCPDEEAVYRALGLPFVAPELREGLGEIEAAEAGTLPDLVEERDLRGILHVHSTWSDGRLSIEEIVDRCSALGYEYVGITDHSQSARYARGLTPESLRQQQMQIGEARRGHPEIRVLMGSEVDILPDGSLDYPEEVLATLDFVVASVHSSFGLKEAEQTGRIVRALRHPRATILGHPTGRLLLAREPYAVNLEEILSTAAREGVCVELNANPHRLDLDTAACRLARSLGARVAIDPDAHDAAGLRDARFGVAVARRAGLTAAHILNASPAGRLDEALARRR
ncbi:MAG: DNA polymerase/3'-5' exonuclease PolX [Acidobacteria bacterium]|nr:DNA polymerase/3'-5' exonuclease PolX [Acidobacteriota bacterium]